MLEILRSSWPVLIVLTGLMCVKKITSLSIPQLKCFGEFCTIDFYRKSYDHLVKCYRDE